MMDTALARWMTLHLETSQQRRTGIRKLEGVRGLEKWKKGPPRLTRPLQRRELGRGACSACGACAVRGGSERVTAEAEMRPSRCSSGSNRDGVGRHPRIQTRER